MYFSKNNRPAYIYRAIKMRLDRVSPSHIGFENGRASVLTSRGKGVVRERRTFNEHKIIIDLKN